MTLFERMIRYSYLSVTDCEFLQKVSENQRWIFNKAVPQNLLSHSTHC